MTKVLITFMLCGIFLYAQKPFKHTEIRRFLNQNNPFVTKATAQMEMAQAQERTAQGLLDTRISLKHDNKQYPLTEGKYFLTDISQPMLNGIEFFAAYRNAQGVQEYNNIKTGKDGEVMMGMKIPFFDFLYDIGQNKFAIESAKYEKLKGVQRGQRELNLLYLSLCELYYRVLFQKEIYKTEKQLLTGAKANRTFISRQVELGNMAPILLAEIDGMVAQRKQLTILFISISATELREIE